MLELARGLSDGALSAIAALEQCTVAADGGRLKLEWSTLRRRSGRDIDDFLWWDAERLTGFLGLYAYGGPTLEIAGMVDPRVRRRGIATALLDAAVPICRGRGYQSALLVTPRGSVGGRELALSRGAVLEHSEHALVLAGPPADGPTDPRIALRTATPADVPDLSRLLTTAFGPVPSDLLDRLETDSERTLAIELEGAIVGTMRVTRRQDTGGVYGFAVDPAQRRRGIGGDALRQACRRLRDEGVERIGLEVAVENDHALGLYNSLGFTRVTTEDYYELAMS
ncbi:MAG TPA: GNAT family N-acetyltransferase [Solirubrobacteraceae bacterium]|jgi:ribosomal protein S18 acetylase RimI-like enzyme|nr:GNAT family N-acetyltransferase [Solirubrobacteraceae bacterium]